MKGAGEHVKSRFAHLSFETYSEIRYIFGPNVFFPVVCVVRKYTHFEAPDDSENGKWKKWT
jgi:hypothetical protein